MPSTTFSDSKPHYLILDGLRGVASIMVVAFHILEIFSAGNHLKQMINHGYLAVDFFFLLSGFVIAHAYDDRWNRMSILGFFKRRLIRLHPMIIIGILFGAIMFYWSASPLLFPPVAETPVWKLIIVTLLGLVLIPVPLSWDIRGWTEMYPLNGPAWSLFFEYIANFLYAFVLKRLSTIVLFIFVLITAVALIHLGVTSPQGDIIGGWSLDPLQLSIGFTRLLFPFLAGLLLHRVFKPENIRNAFTWCSLLLILLLAFPRVGGANYLWANGLYDSLTVILIFPIIIYIGASGRLESKGANRVCSFLGDISYPLYITHFPIAYVYYAWVVNNKLTLQQAWPVGLLVLVVSVILAYVVLKFYDVPVRKWLANRKLKS